MTDEAHGPVAAKMISRLKAALAPTTLTLRNDSAQHAGHAGHDGSGESHFSLVIESAAFDGLSRVERQRLVFKTIGDLMDREIHALQIQASAPH
jgi:BolA protein